jgi:hypothetical protein
VLTRALIDEDIWKEVYADELATILVRIPQVAELDPSEAPGPMPPPGV